MKNGAAAMGLSLWILLGLALSGAFAQEPFRPAGNGKETVQVFKLVGTIEGDPKIAGAIFEDPQTKKQKVYSVGDVIEGATILEIKHQQVLLKRGEEIIVVRITGGSPQAGRTTGGPGDSISVPAGVSNPRQTAISKVIPPYDPRVENEKRSVSRDEVNRFVGYFQEQLTEETPILVTTPLGTAVDLAGVDTEILQSLGLEPTDRIVEINGMGVDSPSRFQQMLEILGGGRGRVFNISVLRGGAIQPLYYAVK